MSAPQIRAWRPEPTEKIREERWLDNMLPGAFRGKAANPSSRQMTVADKAAGTSGEGGVVPDWLNERTTGGGSVSSWDLAEIPINDSLDVKLNGVGQVVDADYTYSGNVVTFASPSTLFGGLSSWTLTAQYQCYGVAATGDLED